MASSKLDIWNIALAHIGETILVRSENETSTAATQLNLHYDAMLEATLDAFPWQFAQKYVALGLVQQDPNLEWGYEYRYPSDCVTAHRVIAESLANLPTHTGTQYTPYYFGSDYSSELRHAGVPFVVALDDNGRVIWTDLEDACLHYTQRVSEPQYWSGTFANALAWRLAAQIAMPLGRDVSLKMNAMQQYQLAILEARGASRNEGRPRNDPNSDMITTR